MKREEKGEDNDAGAPHTEKSTMTEPQEEFIEQTSVPSKPEGPPGSAPESENKEDESAEPKEKST